MVARSRLAVLMSLLIGSACPTEWKEAGAIDQAIRRDMKERLKPPCGDGKHEVPIDPKCQGPNCKPECVDD